MKLVADQMVNGNFWDLGSYPNLALITIIIRWFIQETLNKLFNGAIDSSVFWTLSIYVKLLLVCGTVNHIFV